MCCSSKTSEKKRNIGFIWVFADAVDYASSPGMHEVQRRVLGHQHPTAAGSNSSKTFQIKYQKYYAL